jgi:hypothetical protein
LAPAEFSIAEADSLVLQLAGEIERYRQAQLELLQHVRQLRVNLREAMPSIAEAVEGGNIEGRSSALLTQPPPGYSDSSGHAPQTASASAESAYSAMSRTRRDYDYFSDLDRKLADLEARLASGLLPEQGT